jgi:hypothetical protein
LGNLELSLDFKEFFESLNKNDVRYLVVGGYAVAFHGHPRYTKDIDVWIEATPENAARLIQSLHSSRTSAPWVVYRIWPTSRILRRLGNIQSQESRRFSLP